MDNFAILYSRGGLEPFRAGWIARELIAAGHTVSLESGAPAGLYVSGDEVPELLTELLLDARCVLVVYSEDTEICVGRTFQVAHNMGKPVLPIKLEDFHTAGFMSEFRPAKLFGDDEATDRDTLMRVAAVAKEKSWI